MPTEDAPAGEPDDRSVDGAPAPEDGGSRAGDGVSRTDAGASRTDTGVPGTDASTARTDADASRTGDDDDSDDDGGGRDDPPTDASDEATNRSRHDRVRSHPTPGPGNSLAHWPSARHPLRVAVTYVVVWLVRIAPSLRLKRWLLRRIGVTVGPGVSWGLEATPDVFWPDLLTVEAHAVVGYDATLLCHEFLQEEYRTGEVVIGERAMIGAGAIVLPGVEVGADASVAANSLVTEDVPPGTTVAGVPAKPMNGDVLRDPAVDGDASTGGEN